MTRGQFEYLKINQNRISIHKIDWYDAIIHKHHTIWICDDSKITFSDDHISLAGYVYINNTNILTPCLIEISREQIIKIE